MVTFDSCQSVNHIKTNRSMIMSIDSISLSLGHCVKDTCAKLRFDPPDHQLESVM